MAHSNQVREFLISRNGIAVQDVYLGAGNVLTGSARAAQEAHEQAEKRLRGERLDALRRDLERRREALDAQVAALRAAHEAEAEELRLRIAQEELAEHALRADRAAMAKMRRADGGAAGRGEGRASDAG